MENNDFNNKTVSESKLHEAARYSSNRLKMLVLTAMMTAVTAVCAVISVPLPFSPVPVSLATLAVLISGGVLGAKYGAISQAIYLLLGAVGVPIFHNFTGGLGILVGPTGGFLVGYVLMATVFGRLAGISFRRGKQWQETEPLQGSLNSDKKPKSNFVKLALAAVIATLACYIPGALWFMFVTKNGLAAALTMAIIPFIPVDILKCVIAAWLVSRLQRINLN